MGAQMAWDPDTLISVVHVAAKQQRQVKSAFADPGDTLIAEGVPLFDERLPGSALLAQSVKTKVLQAAKRNSDTLPA